MTTRELIALLQSKDPSGEMTVAICDQTGEGKFESPLSDPDVGVLTRDMYNQANSSAFQESDIGRPFVAI